MRNIKLVINNELNKEKEKFFIKKELQCILNLYAKMVSNGTWKDYSFSSGSKKLKLSAPKIRGVSSLVLSLATPC